MKKKRIIIYTLAVIILLPIIGFRFYIYPLLPLINGHVAKNVCSCMFLANIPEETAMQQELSFSPANLASVSVNKEEKSVTATVWGFRPKTAYYREGYGCALFNKKEPSKETFALTVTRHDSLANWFDYQAKNKTKVLTHLSHPFF